jgi:S-formylglutathione hydrolase FrmB
LRHPDVFGSVISISGYYHVDDPSNMFGGDESAIAANRPDRNLSAARRVRIFLAAADEEDNPVIEGEPQRFKKLLGAAGIPAVLDVRQGGHDWDYVRSVLPAAFTFLAQGWRPAYKGGQGMAGQSSGG